VTTKGFNFLKRPGMAAPEVSEAQAEEIIATHYGIKARARTLGSQQDKNFVITTTEDEIVGVLKVANPGLQRNGIGRPRPGRGPYRAGRAVAADRGAAAQPCR
jgi:hypothetical protein